MTTRPVTVLPLPALSPDAVADLIETVAAAARLLTHELDDISASRSPVSELTVRRLESLLMKLRPAATVRAQLGSMRAAELQAGASRWAQRRGAAIRDNDWTDAS